VDPSRRSDAADGLPEVQVALLEPATAERESEGASEGREAREEAPSDGREAQEEAEDNEILDDYGCRAMGGSEPATGS
jgi:hypothetical protein